MAMKTGISVMFLGKFVGKNLINREWRKIILGFNRYPFFTPSLMYKENQVLAVKKRTFCKQNCIGSARKCQINVTKLHNT